MTIEQLTDEERYQLRESQYEESRKALRIIDEHAADRAALVAQLAAAELRANGLAQSFEAAVDKLTSAESECARLRTALHIAGVVEERLAIKVGVAPAPAGMPTWGPGSEGGR